MPRPINSTFSHFYLPAKHNSNTTGKHKRTITINPSVLTKWQHIISSWGVLHCLWWLTGLPWSKSRVWAVLLWQICLCLKLSSFTWWGSHLRLPWTKQHSALPGYGKDTTTWFCIKRAFLGWQTPAMPPTSCDVLLSAVIIFCCKHLFSWQPQEPCGFAFSFSFLSYCKSCLGQMLVSNSARLLFGVFGWAKCDSNWDNFSSAHVLHQIFVQIQDILKCQKHLCEFLLSGPSSFTLDYCKSQLSAVR